MKEFPYTRILITGGTGSFGKAFVSYLFKKYSNIKRLVIFSRDELKQWEMRNDFPEKEYPQLRFFLGDVRNIDRLRRAFEGVDLIIHAAALKQVPAAEFNPIEFINTNVIGAENVVQASIDLNVKKVVALSTDKAAAPINLYGATKLCSDKLFLAANNISGNRDLKFAIVRYGNVMGSRGSVIPFFMEKAKGGILPITDKSMTRFNISLREGIEMVCWVVENSIGGELFVPKIPSYRITDLANAIAPNCEHKIVGIRPGEKIHEEMITISDGLNTIDLGDYYAILNSDNSLKNKYKDLNINFKTLEKEFSYNSKNNHDFLSVNQLRELIRLNIDKDFVPL